VLYVPASAPPQSADLVLYLHGAGGSEEQGFKRLGSVADQLGFLLLSPASEGRTWDAIRSGFGPDVAFLDNALRRVFAMAPVKRTIVAGFSDGASYALGLAPRNSELFSAAVAFSPGFVAGSLPQRSATKRKPKVFVSHGTGDEILPIDSCSRQLVPRLQREGYSVNYREFPGPHTVPREVAEEGLRWATASEQRSQNRIGVGCSLFFCGSPD
jgi:phospholipase/carboxylesterase